MESTKQKETINELKSASHIIPSPMMALHGAEASVMKMNRNLRSSRV